MPMKTKSKADQKQHPIYKSQLGAIQLAIWANAHDVDGEERTYHTVTMERNYRDKDDQWQKTTQLRAQDVGNAIALLQGVQQHLIKAEAT